MCMGGGGGGYVYVYVYVYMHVYVGWVLIFACMHARMGKATTPHATVRRRLGMGALYTDLVGVEHTGRLELLDQVGKLVDGAALVEHLWGGGIWKGV